MFAKSSHSLHCPPCWQATVQPLVMFTCCLCIPEDVDAAILLTFIITTLSKKYKGRKREDSKGGKKPRVLPTDHRYCIRSVRTLVEKNEPCYIRSYLLAVLASQLVLQFQRHLKDFEILLCRLAGNIAQILFDRSVRYQCPPQICIRIALHTASLRPNHSTTTPWGQDPPNTLVMHPIQKK